MVHHLSFSYRDPRPTPFSQGSPAFLEVCVPGVGAGVPRRVPTMVHHCSLIGTPDPPHSLRVLQRSWESVFLESEPGFPGGYPQWFIISLSLTGTPDPSHSLRVLQRSWESVFLEWEPGFPGGYPQWFTISLSLTGTPDPPHSLRVLQRSWESVFLEWEPGFPGGYPQWFVISYSSDKQYEPRLVVQPPEAIRYNITGEYHSNE